MAGRTAATPANPRHDRARTDRQCSLSEDTMSVPMPAMSPQAGRPPLTDKSIPIASSPQLLERTIVVLQLFTPEQREWTVTEIGRACGLAVPTVHRIVSTLHRHGFLARHELTKRYWLGPAMVRLGRTAAMTIDLRGVSQPGASADLAADQGNRTAHCGLRMRPPRNLSRAD